MKKLIIFVLTIVTVISMAIPAYAVTPPLGVPDVPEIPDISDDVHIELPDGIFDDYIPDIDVELPIEPPVEKPVCPDWHAMMKCWIGWWANAIKEYCDKLPGMCK